MKRVLEFRGQVGKLARRVIDLDGFFPVDVLDLLTYTGLVLVTVGGWLVEPAAGFLLGGGALFYLGVFHGRT